MVDSVSVTRLLSNRKVMISSLLNEYLFETYTPDFDREVVSRPIKFDNCCFIHGVLPIFMNSCEVQSCEIHRIMLKLWIHVIFSKYYITIRIWKSV